MVYSNEYTQHEVLNKKMKEVRAKRRGDANQHDGNLQQPGSFDKRKDKLAQPQNFYGGSSKLISSFKNSPFKNSPQRSKRTLASQSLKKSS